MASQTTETPATDTYLTAIRAADDSLPIAEYGLIADCNSAALVGQRRLDRLAVPAALRRPAVFTRILGADAGHWSIDADGAVHARSAATCRERSCSRRRSSTASGVVRVTDAMAFEGRAARARARPGGARTSCCGWSRASQARSSCELELAPRPEYGLVRPLFRGTGDGGRTFGGPNQIACQRRRSPVEVRESTMRATFTRRARASRSASRCAGLPPRPAAPAADAGCAVAARIEDTAEGWRSWEAEHDVYDGPVTGNWCASAPGCSRD